MSDASGNGMKIRPGLVLVVLLLGSVSPAHGVTFTDAWTAARAKVALLADSRIVGKEIDAIAVEAAGNAVSLRGVVATEAARDAATDTVSRVRGVTRVQNELRVTPSEIPVVLTSDREIRSMVARDLAVFRERGLGGPTVKVRVTDGIATLTGSVEDIGDWVLASERARQTVGVKAVDNRLWIKNLRLSSP